MADINDREYKEYQEYLKYVGGQTAPTSVPTVPPAEKPISQMSVDEFMAHPKGQEVMQNALNIAMGVSTPMKDVSKPAAEGAGKLTQWIASKVGKPAKIEAKAIETYAKDPQKVESLYKLYKENPAQFTAEAQKKLQEASKAIYERLSGPEGKYATEISERLSGNIPEVTIPANAPRTPTLADFMKAKTPGPLEAIYGSKPAESFIRMSPQEGLELSKQAAKAAKLKDPMAAGEAKLAEYLRGQLPPGAVQALEKQAQATQASKLLARARGTAPQKVLMPGEKQVLSRTALQIADEAAPELGLGAMSSQIQVGKAFNQMPETLKQAASQMATKAVIKTAPKVKAAAQAAKGGALRSFGQRSVEPAEEKEYQEYLDYINSQK